MAHSFVKLYVHATFHIARHGNLIPESKVEQLHAYLNGVFCQLGVNGCDIGGTEDHVHVLFLLPATILIGELIGRVKANSSRWMRQQGVRNFRWQIGYAGFSVSASGVNNVRRYIHNQKEHHRIMSYEEEVMLLFREYGIQYTKRFFEGADSDYV
ncbi:MAG: transposase [Ignavibacteriae bacterium]|nr:transposase [Ignavibacteriota bacterium]